MYNMYVYVLSFTVVRGIEYCHLYTKEKSFVIYMKKIFLSLYDFLTFVNFIFLSFFFYK
jgi:hypothetical protein